MKLTFAGLRVLLIEDDPGESRLIQELLGVDAGRPFQLDIFDRFSAAEPRLAQGEFDIVLLDLFLPDSQGMETFSRLARLAPKTPVILLADLDNEPLVLQAIQLGAQDYLVKGHLTRGTLLRSLSYAMERRKIILRKEEWLQNLSHELRNPLATLYGSLRTLVEGSLEGELTKSQRPLIEIAYRSTRQLWAMIDDLLELTRSDTGKLQIEPESLPLAELIGQTVESFAAAAAKGGITLAAVVSAELPPALADPVRVRQILINLINNALKFTPAAGSLTVSAAASVEEEGFLRVSVADTGRGIKPRDVEHIFDRFYQAHEKADRSHKGLGLGLFICADLISRQGGRVWVESVSGQGSTFHFTLPVYSLERLLRRSFSDELLKTRSLILIAVDVLAGETKLSKSAVEYVLSEARSLLKPAGLSADLLLPRAETGQRDNPIFLVACADRAHADILVHELKIKLDNSGTFTPYGTSPTVSYTPLEIPGTAPEPRSILAKTAGLIEELMTSSRRAPLKP